jgi:hypothetical protein
MYSSDIHHISNLSVGGYFMNTSVSFSNDAMYHVKVTLVS